MAAPLTGPGSDSTGRIPTQPSGQPLSSTRQDQPPKPGEQRAPTSPGPQIRTAQDAINLLRTRLDQRLQQSLAAQPGSGNEPLAEQFEPPSAADVAARVLGFIQGRLQLEADAGADQSRLADLLAQARAGVEQGFREAREQIEALGMMNDTLSADIDDGFNRIQEGLASLEDRFLGNEPAERGAMVRGSLAEVDSLSRDALAFEVRTREGDVVQVRMDERRYLGVRAGDGDNEGGVSSAELFAGRYRFTVEGELNEAERGALTRLFEQAQGVAGRFFDGDVQGAFEAAQSLGLEGEELASFSLNLTSTRTIRAAAYESLSEQPSSSTSPLRPLGGLAQAIQQLGRQAQANGLEAGALEGLMSRILEDFQAALAPAEQAEELDPMDDFFRRILARLQPEVADQPT
ncbi:DUF5610 domain-containing protein [Marinobacter sp. SS21]|uniref:DUF5610 domain-containing protein n=1 Tax=Marinobacter sp. SS21 TaxID=2979460 RepID=UPI00232BA6A6|nr:DUF5610 domain-containing protein [Marinobacter sp. SS21]MDC0661545.1 DUF5610 domain-containing protein [Marinobacter sp. SS21]